MLSKMLSGAVNGIDGYTVHVEVDISNGFPCFEIVGLPGSAVRESKERVRTAIKIQDLLCLQSELPLTSPLLIQKKRGHLSTCL